MKAIMVMYDSLNRHMLPPYGCDWVVAPNFQRLSYRSATFDKCFIGSMPCMPARREIHTGRYNFLHRSWGPLEPFDDSMPEILKTNGVYSHLVSDHYHYWEDGGSTYHGKYNTWEISRGQEGDPWIGDLNDPSIPEPNTGEGRSRRRSRQDWVNRAYMQEEKDQPQAKTFERGLDFIEKNHAYDNWFLHIETFDPHEPYFVNQNYKDLYQFDFSRFNRDWPYYGAVQEEDRSGLVDHYRNLNGALISMCDNYLGKVLDAMDRYGLWDDTMLIVNTDHGFLLGEHEYLGKTPMPFFNEVARTPLFIWDPRCKAKGVRRKSFVQTIDLPATILDYFNIPLPRDMQGISLKNTIANDSPARNAGLFGCHGGHVNVTDGRYVYMRAPVRSDGTPLDEYTLMPAHMRDMFKAEELESTVLSPPFSFTKSCPVMRIASPVFKSDFPCPAYKAGTLLYDIDSDPSQQIPVNDKDLEKRMIGILMGEMKANDCPKEQFDRLGLSV